MRSGHCVGKYLVTVVVSAYATMSESVVSAADLGSAFTYQGRLTSGGALYEGVVDLEFTLWDADSGGNMLGGPSVVHGYTVTDGLISVTVNTLYEFGDQAFDGGARWLALSVNGETLSPRQALTPAPYAHFAADSKGGAGDGHSLDAVDGDPIDVVFVNSAGSVGIGTSDPDGVVHIVRPDATNPKSLVLERIGEFTRRHIDIAADDSLRFTRTGIADDFTIDVEGQVGIGTNSPSASLEVRSNGPDDFNYDEGAAAHFHFTDTDTLKSTVSISNVSPNAPALQVLGYIRTSGIASIASDSTNLEHAVRGSTHGSGAGLFGITSDPATGPALLARSDHVLGSDIALFQYFDDIVARIDSDGRGYFDGGIASNGNNVLNGPVGILTENTGAFSLAVAGPAAKQGGGSWSVFSDERLKKNIDRLDGSLERMLSLRGTTFEYRDPTQKFGMPGQQIGLIAQEVEQVFPQWVDEDADGYKFVTIRGFEALTVESMRELRKEKDAQIADLQARIAQLETALDRFAAAQ